jgi:hypothetical protein
MGEKKVKGRKRHIVTDIEGHLLHVKSLLRKYLA